MSDSRYRITERVAAGGMAEVFRGVAESIQGFRKNVAIKRVLPALTKNKKFVAMFLDEARLSLHLQHANIVQVFDIGHTDETYFIVMEFVEGVDLKRLLEWRRRIGRPLTIGQTIYIIMEVCKGLAYAHEAVHPETGRPLGIVHRDVSPPNVLLSRNGEIKVTDFGLAKAAVQVETTDPGVVKGKMSYLSPEAARGTEVDRRADIFAVGILMYEMLTGKRLFYGETDYQTVELVRAAKIPPIGAQNPEVEPELEEIVRKALARRPDDRFQSATDLQDAMAQYLFSRGLKMIQRDISDLVRACAEEQGLEKPVAAAARKPRGNVIDTMLQEEINSFESVEFEEQRTIITPPPDAGAVAAPHPPMASSEFVDPRGWADETARQRMAQARAAAAASAGLHPAPPQQQPPPPPRVGPPLSVDATTGRAFGVPAPPVGPARGGPPPPPVQPAHKPAQMQPPMRPSPTAPAPVAPPPAQVLAPAPHAARPANPVAGLFAGIFAGRARDEAFKPTPTPERLADVLEPRGPGGARAGVHRGLFVGVIAAALAFGVLVAWLIAR